MVTAVLLLINSSFAYFSYQDCDPDCIHYRACCTITEISESYFPSQCTKTQAVCEEIASPTVVCLRPDDPPIGGEEIWPAFEKQKAKHHRTTPKPIVEPRCEKWKLVAVIVISIAILYIAQLSLMRVIRHYRRRNYESARNLATNAAYQETVQDIDEPIE